MRPGNKLTAQNPQFQYQTLPDALANIPTSINASLGTPHNAVLDELWRFFQDDWRLGANLVLNLGVRYDYYLPIVSADDVRFRGGRQPGACDRPAQADFGPQTDHLSPYDAGSGIARDWVSRDASGTSDTVVRGGVGFLYSPHTQRPYDRSPGSPTSHSARSGIGRMRLPRGSSSPITTGRSATSSSPMAPGERRSFR
jgi:hypothetical protein